MGGNIQLNVNLRGLDKIREGLATDLVAKVGIFGAQSVRTGSDPITNAELAVVHIFGSVTRNIPARDFLKMPIEMKGQELVKALSNGVARKLIMNGDAIGLLAYLGVKAENIVQEAFASGGFGQWAPNAPATIRKKGSSAPLIDTAALRRAVTSTVEKP